MYFGWRTALRTSDYGPLVPSWYVTPGEILSIPHVTSCGSVFLTSCCAFNHLCVGVSLNFQYPTAHQDRLNQKLTDKEKGSGEAETDYFKVFLKKLFLVVLGCAWVFSSCGQWGRLSGCSVKASHCSDFSPC